MVIGLAVGGGAEIEEAVEHVLGDDGVVEGAAVGVVALEWRGAYGSRWSLPR